MLEGYISVPTVSCPNWMDSRAHVSESSPACCQMKGGKTAPIWRNYGWGGDEAAPNSNNKAAACSELWVPGGTAEIETVLTKGKST